MQLLGTLCYIRLLRECMILKFQRHVIGYDNAGWGDFFEVWSSDFENFWFRWKLISHRARGKMTILKFYDFRKLNPTRVWKLVDEADNTYTHTGSDLWECSWILYCGEVFTFVHSHILPPRRTPHTPASLYKYKLQRWNKSFLALLPSVCQVTTQNFQTKLNKAASQDEIIFSRIGLEQRSFQFLLILSQ